MPYKTKDSEGVLPFELHNKAIAHARQETGMNRPVMKQLKYIKAYRQCFKDMQELGMVKKEFMNVKR